KAEAWMGRIVQRVRDNKLQVSHDSALYQMTFFREPNLLPINDVAVELLNVLRPFVAISRYITFAIIALHRYPELKNEIDDENFAYSLTHEIRRFYPFFPFLAAKVIRDFEWREHYFPKGLRVILDIYGTNRDEKSWQEPNKFNPHRFKN